MAKAQDPDEPHRSLHDDHVADTKRALVAAARDLFATQGYEATSTEQILSTARVSRGSMYFHFTSKQELFVAVLEQVEAEFIERMVATGVPGDDVWEELTNGCLAFLDVSMEAPVRRIMLTDGPSVLGWTAWNEIEARHGRGLLRDFLQQAMGAGLINVQPVEPLVLLLTGALNEAALAIANARHPAATRRQLGDALRWIFDSLRAAQQSSSEHRRPA